VLVASSNAAAARQLLATLDETPGPVVGG
jgi:hypothetical protein